MKKTLTVVAVIILIVALVFVYLKIGKKGAEETRTYVETTTENVQKAQGSVNEMNKSIQDARNAADQAMGR